MSRNRGAWLERLEFSNAVEHFDEALVILRSLLAESAGEGWLTHRMARALDGKASALVRGGFPVEARSVLDEARRVYEGLSEREPQARIYFEARKGLHQRLGELAFQRGDIDGAREQYERAIALHDEIVTGTPRPLDRISLAILLQGLAEILYQGRAVEGAEESARRSLTELEAVLATSPEDRTARRLQVLSALKRARALRGLERVTEAVAQTRAALVVARALSLEDGGGEPKVLLAHGMSATLLAWLLIMEGERHEGARDEARQLADEAIEVVRSMTGSASLPSPYDAALAQVLATLRR